MTDNERMAARRMNSNLDRMNQEFGDFQMLNITFPNAPLGPRAWANLHSLHKRLGELLKKERSNAA